jgi:hypothetical protein
MKGRPDGCGRSAARLIATWKKPDKQTKNRKETPLVATVMRKGTDKLPSCNPTDRQARNRF